MIRSIFITVKFHCCWPFRAKCLVDFSLRLWIFNIIAVISFNQIVKFRLAWDWCFNNIDHAIDSLNSICRWCHHYQQNTNRKKDEWSRWNANGSRNIHKHILIVANLMCEVIWSDGYIRRGQKSVKIHLCAILKCFVNALANCPRITTITWNIFVGLWGGINFNLFGSGFFLQQPNENILSSSSVLFSFVLVILGVSPISRLCCLPQRRFGFRSNHSAYFMCYLHTIYSDFPQFKINYVASRRQTRCEMCSPSLAIVKRQPYERLTIFGERMKYFGIHSAHFNLSNRIASPLS